MKKGRKFFFDLIKTLLFLTLGIFLIWLVIKDLSDNDKTEIINSFKQAHIGVIIAIIIVALLSHFTRALRWQLMIEPLGIKPGLINTFFAVIIGYLANLAIPRLGEVSRCGVLKRYENVPFDGAFGTVVTERIIDVLLLLLVCITTILFQFSILYDSIQNWILHPILQKLHKLEGNKLYGMIALFIVAIITILFLYKKMLSSSLFQKIKKTLYGFSEGIQSIRKLKNPWLFVFYSILIWVFYLLNIYIGFNALNETTHLGMGAALSLLFFGTFAFIIVQGGIGAYQIIVMKTLILYGITTNIGFALGWLFWGIQTIVIIFFGLISLILLPILNDRIKQNALA